MRREGGEESVRFAVFVLVFVVEHREIRLIAALGDVVVFDSLEHGTAGLMGVGAVAEAALFGELKDFLEVAGQFFALHVERAEAFDARGVDEVAGY